MPPNSPFPSGIVNEIEPNNALEEHQSLLLPTTVHGIIEPKEVSTIVVRGDGIEDIYRVDLTTPGFLTIDLFNFPKNQNLDVYLVLD